MQGTHVGTVGLTFASGGFGFDSSVELCDFITMHLM